MFVYLILFFNHKKIIMYYKNELRIYYYYAYIFMYR